MLGLGLRESEALGARWKQINFEGKTFTPADTAEPIPMPSWLAEYLGARAPGGMDRKASGYIVVAPNGRPHASGYTRRAFQSANKTVSTPGLTNLRDSFAAHLSEVGVPVLDIHRAMRNRNLKTTFACLGIEAT